MTKLNIVEALNLALSQEMEKDESILVLGEDVGVDGGVFRVTDGLIKKFGKDRQINYRYGLWHQFNCLSFHPKKWQQ